MNQHLDESKNRFISFKNKILETIKKDTESLTILEARDYFSKRIDESADESYALQVSLRIHYLLYAQRHNCYVEIGYQDIVKDSLKLLNHDFTEKEALRDDLMQVVSQIEMSNQEVWKSIFHIDRAMSELNQTYDRHNSLETAKVIRSMKVGQVWRAKELLEKFSINDFPQDNQRLLKLIDLRTTRILGDYLSAMKKGNHLLENGHFSARQKTEVIWETQLLHALMDGDFLGLVEKVLTNRRLKENCYIVESYLYFLAKGNFPDSLPPLSSVVIEEDDNFVIKIALKIDQCFREDNISDETLEDFIQAYPEISFIENVDTRLTLKACFVRLFDRAKKSFTRDLTLSEFHLENLRYSNGKSRDCLGILTDMIHESDRISHDFDLMKEIERDMNSKDNLERRDHTELGRIRRQKFERVVQDMIEESNISEKEAVTLIRKVFNSVVMLK